MDDIISNTDYYFYLVLMLFPVVGNKVDAGLDTLNNSWSHYAPLEQGKFLA